MQVRFNEQDEFLKELERPTLAVASNVVRVTTLRFLKIAAIYGVQIVATAKVWNGLAGHDDWDVIEYRRDFGELWGVDADTEVKDRVNAAADELRAKLRELGFEVIGGVYSEPKPAKASR